MRTLMMVGLGQWDGWDGAMRITRPGERQALEGQANLDPDWSWLR